MEFPGNTSLSFLYDFARQLNPHITLEEVERLAALAAINTQQQQQQQQPSSTAAATAVAALPDPVTQQCSSSSTAPPQLLPPTLQLHLPAATPAAAVSAAAVPAVIPAHPHIGGSSPVKLSLEIGHSCLSSGCGDSSCSLCQHNERRRCRADLKQKYVTRDYLRSNCGAGLLIRLVDDKGQQYMHPLPGWKLQVCVVDARRYKEVNPTNVQLGFDALAPCILDKPLLRWENGSETAVVTLPVEYGQVHLPDLQCFSISGEHRAGKACDYRLAFWVEHQPILPRVSEPFTVVCLRSRGAVKSEIPLSDDPVGRLDGIGEQAVSTLKSLGTQLGPGSGLPAELACIDRVMQFCELVKLVQSNSQLEKQLLPLFKKADWKKATQHAACTVFPDYRPRVWWYPRDGSEDSRRIGLLFRCENAVVQIQRPFAWVQRAQATAGALSTLQAAVPDEIRVFAHLGPQEQQAMQLAAQDWDSPQHGQWSIYWLDPADPLAQQSLNPNSAIAQTLGMSSNPEHLPFGILAAAGITSPAAAGLQCSGSAVLAAAVATASAAAANTSNSVAAAAAASGAGHVAWSAPQQQELQAQQQLADLHLVQHLANIQQQQQQQQLLLPLSSPFFPKRASGDTGPATITTGAALPQEEQAVQQQQQQQLPWGNTAGSTISEAMAPWLSQPPAAAAPAATAASRDPLMVATTALATIASAAAVAAAAAAGGMPTAAPFSSPAGSSSSTLTPVSLAASLLDQQQQNRRAPVSMFSPPAGLLDQLPASLRGEVVLADQGLTEQKSDPLSVSMAWIPDHLAEAFPESLIPGVMQMRSLGTSSREQSAAAAAAGAGSRGTDMPGQRLGLKDSDSLPSDLFNSALWKSVLPPAADGSATGAAVWRDIMTFADSFRQRVQQPQQQHDHDHDGDVHMTPAAMVTDTPPLSQLERAAASRQPGAQMPASLLKSDSLLGSEQERLLQECNQALLIKYKQQQQQQQQRSILGWHR